MTIRCRSRLCALLFCLPLGLCVAGTAFGASDDDDEEWHDTKGPGGKKLDDDEDRPKKSKRADSDEDKKSDDDDKKADDKKSDDDDKRADEKKSDDDDKKADDKKSDDDESSESTKHKKKAKWKSKGLDSSTKVSFAALGSWGFPNPLGAGLGLRGGAHIQGLLPIYVGGVAEYFFGTQSIVRDSSHKSTRSVRLMYFGAEVGADIDATNELQLRPYFGLGLASNKDTTCDTPGACHGGSDIHATITPGIAGLYYLGTVFLGADLRYLIVPGASTASGAIASATVGARF